MMRMVRVHGVGFSLVCLAILALPVSPVRSQQSPVVPHPEERFADWGRETHTVPVASNQGVWDGTWFYVSRDQRIALWIRTEDGAPRVKLRYASMNSAEGFETDWSGASEYQLREAEGSFSLGIDQRDADTITGHWEWLLQTARSARAEEGTYRMYRTGDGRFLAMVFDELVRTVSGGGKNRIYRGSVSWTFRKASKRLVLWDELPF